MATIKEIRQKYPQYNGISDQELAQKLHAKYYSDMPIQEFRQRIGFVPESKMSPFISGIEGFNRGFENVTQGLIQPIVESGIFGQAVKKGFQNVGQEREARFAEAKEQNPKSAMLGNILADIGTSIPFFAGGAGIAKAIAPNIAKSMPLASRVLGAGIGGAGFGGAQYVNPEESRLKNALIGGALGAALEPVIPIAGAGLKSLNTQRKRLFGAPEIVEQDLMSAALPEEMRKALEVKLASERIGVPVTPAEATGNPLLAEAEAASGKTKAGQQQYYEFKKSRQESEKDLINRFINEIAPEGGAVNREARTEAERIIQRQKDARKAEAAPYYKKAYSDTIKETDLKDLLQDSNINKAFSDISSNTTYGSVLKNVKKNSVEFLDYVKKDIDDKIETAKRAGENNKVRILQDSKSRLVSELDKISPDYKKARALFAEGSPAVEALEKSDIGRIANMNDTQLQNVTKTIFDRSETDPKVLETIRVEISKDNPDLWKRIIRSEMERRLDTANVSATEAYGSNFYNKILREDKDFKQFKEALAGDKNAQKKLEDMKLVFKDLINARTVKGAAGRAENSMNMPRSSGQFAVNAAKDLLGGAYDKTALDIITSNKWDAYFKKALEKPKAERDALVLKLMQDINFKKSRVPSQIAIGEATQTSGRPDFDKEY